MATNYGIDVEDDFTPSVKPDTSREAAQAGVGIEDVDWSQAAQPSEKKDGLERIKAEPSEVIRFAFVPGFRTKSAYRHFMPLNGFNPRSYLCTRHPSCPGCTQKDKPQRQMVAMAVQYMNADAAGCLPNDADPGYQVGFVSLSETNFRDIQHAIKGHNYLDVDLRMAYDERKYSFDARPNPRHAVRGETAVVERMAEPLFDLLEGKLGIPFPTGNLTKQSSTPSATPPPLVKNPWKD